MIEIDGKYRISSDEYQWVLETKAIGKDKEGNEKEKWKKTYHPRNFASIANAICDKEMKGCIKTSMEESIECFKTQIEKLTKAIEGGI